MKEFFKKMMISETDEYSQSYENLIKKLENTMEEISQLDSKFDYVTDSTLLSQIIFQRKAAEMKYRYWYKIARNNIPSDN